MKSLKHPLKDYLRIRRSLGFRLREAEGLLWNFVVFLEAEGAPYITRERALRWATQPATAQPATWAGHLGMVRRFALWHSGIDPRTEIPPLGLLPHRYRRKPPHSIAKRKACIWPPFQTGIRICLTLTLRVYAGADLASKVCFSQPNWWLYGSPDTMLAKPFDTKELLV